MGIASDLAAFTATEGEETPSSDEGFSKALLFSATAETRASAKSRVPSALLAETALSTDVRRSLNAETPALFGVFFSKTCLRALALADALTFEVCRLKPLPAFSSDASPAITRTRSDAPATTGIPSFRLSAVLEIFEGAK
jgi:hypothetical protein